MKRCLNCSARFASETVTCPDCDTRPVLIDGFESYASDYAHGGGGFKADYFAELARLEGEHFWFRSRNELIVWALEKYCANFESFFEIGCGTGYVLTGISRHFRNVKLHGSEIFVSGLEFAASRLPSVKLMQMDAREIPFEIEFDVIGAFDVLEHIEEDDKVLAQMHGALKDRGFIVLTVPQHAWLWSPTDDYACHVRRYSGSDLRRKIERAGFRVIRSSSFVTLLLPAMMASRFFQRISSSADSDATSELKIAPWINSVFYRMLRIEQGLIKRGVDLPVGGSRLVVAEKIGAS